MSAQKRTVTETAAKWWKESVVYQIYPSSFKDNNGDGWGDIKGITEKLDYLQDLGADVLWCSPMFKSPQADMGYDIADYKDMDPIYGSMEDIDELFAELKKRGMKMMMDLVVNHTSDQHEWFTESRSSKDNPKRDWYIWRQPSGTDENGNPEPPNNWAQILGDQNSAWTYAPETGEFFLSLFTPEQPDLNWENPEVRAAVHDVMDFWLQRGACGFRMDVINMISKVPGLPDAPINMPPGHKYQSGEQFYVNGPRLHEYLREIHDKVLAKYDTMTVGEMPGIDDANEIIRTVGSDAGELNMIFIFDICMVDTGDDGQKFNVKPFRASDIAKIQTKWQETMLRLDGWNSIFIENHDQGRSVSRYTDDSDQWRDKGAKLLALMQTTLAGTLFVYQGEELGIRNFALSWDPETEYKDVEAVNYWKKAKILANGDEKKLEDAKKGLQRKARDHARTPMQWTAGSNAGFSDEGVKPWMRVNDDYETINAEYETRNSGDKFDGGLSVFQYWKRALASRKENKETLVYGGYEQVGTDQSPDQIFAYVRTPNESLAKEGDKGFLVLLNFSGEDVNWQIPRNVSKWAAGNYGPAEIDQKTSGQITVRPWEGLLGVLEG